MINNGVIRAKLKNDDIELQMHELIILDDTNGYWTKNLEKGVGLTT
jgi:hypothetical protein